MTAPTEPRAEACRVIDIRTSGSTTLRVALVDDGPGGRVLILAHGFGGGEEPFRRPDWCSAPLRLPADALPELRGALEVLEASGG